MPRQGSCLCKRVQVTVNDKSLPLTPLICHCYNCRKTAGSTYSTVAIVDLDDLHIEGKLEEYRDHETLSGNTTSRYFCGGCGSPIHTAGPSRPGKTVVKLGLFVSQKDPLDLPAAEIFTVNREKWESPISGAKQFEHLAKKG